MESTPPPPQIGQTVERGELMPLTSSVLTEGKERSKGRPGMRPVLSSAEKSAEKGQSAEKEVGYFMAPKEPERKRGAENGTTIISY
jgi:hypothetical protein